MSRVALVPAGDPGQKLRTAVLFSGRGSNLRALLEAQRACKLPFVDFRIVISNRPGAGGLEVAKEFGVPTAVVDHEPFGRERAAHEKAILDILYANEIEFVVLAGYMRLLTPALLTPFHHRMINVHPSLLPSFPGATAQKDAFEYGAKVSGCTVHLVTAEMDMGPIILQRPVRAPAGGTAETLAARILAEEHIALPHALDLASRERLYIEGRRVRIVTGPTSFPELEPEIDAVFPLFIATGNLHKKQEIAEILSDLPLFLQGTELFDEVTDPVEDAASYLGNARLKAAFWQEKAGGWALADDSGIEVDALGGRPGIHSNRYAPGGKERIARMLGELKDTPEDKRGARFVCHIVLCGPNGEEFTASGTCEGRIAFESRGSHGFGYDPIFIPNGFDGQHLAELDEKTKNRISHRGNALRSLRPAFEKLIPHRAAQ